MGICYFVVLLLLSLGIHDKVAPGAFAKWSAGLLCMGGGMLGGMLSWNRAAEIPLALDGGQFTMNKKNWSGRSENKNFQEKSLQVKKTMIYWLKLCAGKSEISLLHRSKESIPSGGYVMKHIKTLTTRDLKESMKKGGCGECQTSCQSACKTSCTVGNQSCEKVGK